MPNTIPFFKTTITSTEKVLVQDYLQSTDSASSKKYIELCVAWFKSNYKLEEFYLTKSCTHALELAALVADIQPGDEVIMPSYAFVSCANAFVLRGAVCVFIDIRPNGMMMDETKIEAAITPKTKAILTLNYAGVAQDYSVITAMAKKYNLLVIEDNAHGLLAKQNGRLLGSFGDISTFSFDHLKNITCGQGGGIAVNNPALLERFYLAYEFGTNRRSFFNHQANRYEWKAIGSNFPLSELNASMLYAQLLEGENITAAFVRGWDQYFSALKPLQEKGLIELPILSNTDEHSGHCFYIKVKDKETRKALIDYLTEKDIIAQFHYVPLHSSEFGQKVGRFSEDDDFTTKESARLVRLPLFHSITAQEIDRVVQEINSFYQLV